MLLFQLLIRDSASRIPTQVSDLSSMFLWLNVAQTLDDLGRWMMGGWMQEVVVVNEWVDG